MLNKLRQLEEAGILTVKEYEGKVRIMVKTVLVVDDNERLRTLVKSYLTQEGYRVVTAADGREALFVARQDKPDLIRQTITLPSPSA
jgi:PleD family two-component response regulator